MSGKESSKGLNRRDFVKTTAIGAGALTLGSFGLKKSAHAMSWDNEVDVVVIGAGAAGFAASIAAAEKGASVVLLEKLGIIGGNSGLSGGNFGAWGTDLQKSGPYRGNPEDPMYFEEDSAELYFKEKRAMGCYRSNPKLTWIFAKNSHDDYYWIRSMGFEHTQMNIYEKEKILQDDPRGVMTYSNLFNREWDENGTWKGVFTKGRHHVGGSYKGVSGGAGLIMAMRDKAQSLGVKIVTDSPMSEIIREQPLSGNVLGVKVKETRTGNEVTYRAKKGVVLAAGGFSNDMELCNRYDSRIDPEKVRSTGSAGVTGDVLRAALNIGASTMNMDFVQTRMDRSAVSYLSPYSRRMFSNEGTYIDVDAEGKRFWMEMEDKYSYRSARTTICYEKDTYLWWGVTDAAGVEAHGRSPEYIQETLEMNQEVKYWGRLYNAYAGNTLEELASKIGVPGSNLVATVNRYNQFVDQGRDADYGQHKEKLTHKIEKGPFYAIPKTFYVQHTCGGFNINENAQVIDINDNIIPNLYAAGEMLGGVHGIERNGGCGITEAVVFGRIAGTDAASKA